MVKVLEQVKTYILDKRDRHSISIRNWLSFRNIPYADHFSGEEGVFLVSLPKQPINPSLPYKRDVVSHKSAYRNTSQMIFHKKVPLFQSKIEKGAAEKGVQGFQLWTEWALSKVPEYRAKHPLPVNQQALSQSDS